MIESQVTVRDINEDDVPNILNYWYSDPGFIESMGVDLAKMTPKAQFDEMLRKKLSDNNPLPNSKLNALAICYEGQAVGFHTINPVIEGDHGIFHAHIWDPSMRRKGIGHISYPKACRVFMERFNLQRILFKTPIQNSGAHRVKEKLKIPLIDEEVLNFGIYKDGTKAKVYELSREALAELPS